MSSSLLLAGIEYGASMSGLVKGQAAGGKEVEKEVTVTGVGSKFELEPPPPNKVGAEKSLKSAVSKQTWCVSNDSLRRSWP